MALLGALAKFGMGMMHGDGNTRQCMATAVVAYKEAFGFDAPPYTYADFEQSDVIVLVGSNLCIAHPILWQRVMRNPHRPEIIVLDPRATETTMAATQHLAVASEIRPDAALRRGADSDRARMDRPPTSSRRIRADSTNSQQFVEEFTLERVAAETRLSAEVDRALGANDPPWQASVVLVDDGRESKPSGRSHGASDHQSGLDDR